jgi:hypothetical protein
MAASCQNTVGVAYVNGLFSGFPSGINNVSILYSEGKLDRKTTNSLLLCCANASPAYLITFIGSSLLSDRKAGISLFIAQTAVSFIVAVIFGVFDCKEKTKTKPIAFVPTVCTAVSGAVINTINVCGYIIFFGTLANVLTECKIISAISKILPFNQSEAEAVITGFIEITQGLRKSKNFVTVGMLVGFSGISVILQCTSPALKAGLDAKNIVIGKLIYTALIPSIAYTVYKLICTNGIVYALLLLTFFIIVAVGIHFIFDKSVNRLYNKKKNTETENDFFKRHTTDVSVLRTR